MVTSGFVGRRRELHRLGHLLRGGRNVVVTGRDGSGRTALVRQFALSHGGEFAWVFVGAAESRRAVRRRLESALPPLGADRFVLVLDDLVKVTPQRLTTLRDLSRRAPWLLVAVVDRSVGSGALTRVRAVLGSAPVIELGPVGVRAAEEYFAAAARAHARPWSDREIRDMARAAHGSPLGMRLLLDAALQASAAGREVR